MSTGIAFPNTPVSLYRWWKNDGKSKSGLVTRGSLLYRAKKRFMRGLEARGIVHDDRPNCVPHVTLLVDGWRDREGPFMAANKHTFTLHRGSLVVNSDHAAVVLELDVPSKRGIHMTLLFKPQIKADHEQAVRDVWDETLASLAAKPEDAEDDVLSPYEQIIDQETAEAANKPERQPRVPKHERRAKHDAAVERAQRAPKPSKVDVGGMLKQILQQQESMQRDIATLIAATGAAPLAAQ